MKIQVTTLALASTLLLVGCTGPGEYFEPKTNGVRNSKWTQLSTADKDAVEISFHEQERLKEQLRLNNLMRKQSKKVAKAERNNQAKQKHRLNDENAHLKQEQEKNDFKLESITNPITPNA